MSHRPGRICPPKLDTMEIAMTTPEGSTALNPDPVGDAAEREQLAATYAGYDRQVACFRERTRAALPVIKAAVFDALQAAGIIRLLIEFDGCGDSGQMEPAVADTAEETGIDLPDMRIEIPRVHFDKEKDAAAVVPLDETVEHLAYELLEERHSGWEENEGGFGTFTFDVAARTITLDFGRRFTDAVTYVHTF